jgi:hypothetical protein
MILSGRRLEILYDRKDWGEGKGGRGPKGKVRWNKEEGRRRGAIISLWILNPIQSYIVSAGKRLKRSRDRNCALPQTT